LGVVGDGYKIVQNVEAFSFFDHVVGEGQAIYHTAGALNLGQRIWILAKLPKNIVLTREDVVEKYMVLTNSHDGTSALKLFFTPIRIICSNTLSMALKDAKDGISIRHSGDITSKVKEARKILGISLKWYNEFEELCKQLLGTQLSKSQVEGYYDRLLYGEEIDEKKKKVQYLKIGSRSI
jgi:phage/plasmid-like protein (TIGR03299 family)